MKRNERFKEIVTEHRLTHAKVSQMLGVSASAVSKWSSGDRNIPKASLELLEIKINGNKQ